MLGWVHGDVKKEMHARPSLTMPVSVAFLTAIVMSIFKLQAIFWRKSRESSSSSFVSSTEMFQLV